MEDPQIRASDAERDQVAERLSEACAHGRLDISELEERIEAAYAARTVRELQALVVDLPAPRRADLPVPGDGPGSPATAASPSGWPSLGRAIG